MKSLEFRDEVAKQENQHLYNQASNYKVKVNVAPEDSGGHDIGFGHKITSNDKSTGKIHGHRYIYGVTKDQALDILEKDIHTHLMASRAFVGFERWESIPTPAQQLLCDFSFTGVISKFPKLIMSIFDKNLNGVLMNYKRYFTYKGQRKEMDQRNGFALRLIQELVQEGYFD